MSSKIWDKSFLFGVTNGETDDIYIEVIRQLEVTNIKGVSHKYVQISGE